MHVTDEMVEATRSVVKWLDGFRRMARDTGFLWMADDAESHARALEAALRAAPAAAPVAWQARQYIRELDRWSSWCTFGDKPSWGNEDDVQYRPLYTAPPAPVADGWVMVPREPTPQMHAAMHAYDGKQYSDPFDADDFAEDYRAMLAAAPTEAGR